MKIGAIVLKLRIADTYFKNNIGGAADLDLATSGTLLQDMAFVIPLAEDAELNKEDNSVNQNITERFGVVVAISNDTTEDDLTGITAYDKLHDVRDELFSALVGWDPGYNGPVAFRGGRLLAIDRAWLWYQYEFEYPAILMTDTSAQGALQETAYMGSTVVGPEELADFLKVYTQYIMTPSVKWQDCLKLLVGEGKHLPITAIAPDMTQIVDMTEQYEGGFAEFGWGTGFDFFRPRTI